MSVERQNEDQSNMMTLEKRLERISEYLAKSLNDADPLQANLGASSSDLMAMALRLKVGIDNALDDGSDLMKQFQEIAPIIELYLKLNRQADRFMEQSRRWLADQATVPAASSR